MKNRKYTNYKLSVKPAKRPKYWVRCLFKQPNGKPNSHWEKLKHNGEDMFVDTSEKKVVNFEFTQFVANMQKGRLSSEYIKETKTFEERVFEIAHKGTERHYKATFDLIENNIDEGFRLKKINEVMNQDYLIDIQENFQKIVTLLEDGKTDKIIFPRRTLQPQTVANYFKHFKTACNKINKKKLTGFYPVNLEAIEYVKISQDLKVKLQEKRKFLSPNQVELVENMPSYQEITSNLRGSWVDTDKDYKEALLFIMHTGYRQKDISRLKWEHIKEVTDRDGKLITVVKLLTHKASKDSFVPIGENTLNILPEKRQGSDHIFKVAKTTALRCIEFKKYMGYVETYMKKKNPNFDVDCNITLHMGRHHFIQTGSAKNISNALLSKMVGCTEQNIAKTYKKITGDDILAVADIITDNSVKLVRKKDLI